MSRRLEAAKALRHGMPGISVCGNDWHHHRDRIASGILVNGGTAWPNVQFPNSSFDYLFTIWLNGTLGLLSFWWHSNRQMPGRARTTIRAVEYLPVLDFRELSHGQLATAKRIFEEFRDKELKPAYLADADPNRALLDRRVICDLLGFGEEIYEAVRHMSAKWRAEPSVYGRKKRPRGAKLVL